MKIRLRKFNGGTNFSTGEKLILFLLFLSFIDLKQYGMHMMLCAFALFGCMRGKLYAPKGALPMLLLTASLVVFSRSALSGLTSIITCIIWPLAYLLGYGLITNTDDDDAEHMQSRAWALLKLAAAGLFAHYVLNMLINFGTQDLGRNTLDFWSGEPRAATGQAALAIVPMGWAVAKIVNAGSFKGTLGGLLVLLLIFYYNLTLGTRILLLLLPILFAIAFIYNLKTQKFTARRRKMVTIILIIVLLVALVYILNLWGVRDIIEESALSQRYENNENMGITEDSRWERKLEYLKLMPTQLLGGGSFNAQVGGHAHDVFLDTYDEAGIFALIAVIAIIWDAISKLRKLLKNEGINYAFKITMLCVYSAMFIEFMVEPILQGMALLFAAFCFLNGIITACLKCCQKNMEKQQGVSR